MEHPLHFADPYGLAPIFVLLDLKIDRVERTRTVMLGPVEFDAPGDPRSRQSYKRRFDHLIIVDKVTLPDLVVRHLNSSAEFRQYHDFEVLIFQEQTAIGFVPLLLQNFFDDRMRVYEATASLIDPVLQKDWIFFWFSDAICRNDYIFLPSRHSPNILHLNRLFLQI